MFRVRDGVLEVVAGGDPNWLHDTPHDPAAIFGQVRLGERGRPFRCYKFRTMRHDAEAFLRSDVALHRLYVENDFKLPVHLDPRLK